MTENSIFIFSETNDIFDMSGRFERQIHHHHGDVCVVIYESRIFAQYAPTMWSSLLSETRSITNIDTFKRSIKTFLFKRYYHC